MRVLITFLINTPGTGAKFKLSGPIHERAWLLFSESEKKNTAITSKNVRKTERKEIISKL